jgi:hypothetical protein
VTTRNILQGDAMSLELPGSNAPIIFSEWCFVSGSRIQRKDYALNNLIAYQPFEDDNLFSDLGEQAFIPPPIQVYPVMHFMDLADD